VWVTKEADIINRVACIDVYFDDSALLDGAFNARMAQRSSEDPSTMVDEAFVEK
jgi:hypothetical protein